MTKNQRPLLALFALLLLAIACANPIATPSSPAEPVNVETIVAATLSALTASSPSDSATPLPATQPADTPSDLLPHSMYYLASDSAQVIQIYRLEKDGKTVTQLTSEPVSVEDYDVSLLDGSLVYVSDNKLINIRADGSNRSMLFDGGAKDPNNPFLTNVSNPVFSPDNQTIAFSYKGLNLYSIIDGQARLVLKDDVTDFGGGLLVPSTLYRPEIYTSDGSKLILTLAHYEGASAAIYQTSNGSLVQLNNDQGALICCGDYSISNDGSSLYSGSPTFGMFPAGLWRVDLNSGNVTTLMQGDLGSTNPLDTIDNPFIAPDGQLYFFYASVPTNGGDIINRPPLQIVRSATDGVTGRTVLRPETFTSMNEALWAPDASFVIVVVAQNDQTYIGGAAQLYYTDSQKAMISLLPYAQNMKWGP